LLQIAKAVGLWRVTKSAKYLRYFAIVAFVVIVSANIVLKIMLIPSIENVQDAMAIFIYLPFVIMILLKYLNFLFKAKQIGDFLSNVNRMYSQLDSKPSLLFSEFPFLLRFQVYFNAIAPFMIVAEAFKTAFAHELVSKYWTPESWKEDPSTFWIYYAFERAFLFYTTPMVIAYEILIPLFLVHLKRIAKLHAASVKSLSFQDSQNYEKKLLQVLRNHQLYKT